MDDADKAQVLVESHLDRSLKNKPKTIVPYSGACLFCQEPVEQARFCGSECREAYDEDILRRKRQGLSGPH